MLHILQTLSHLMSRYCSWVVIAAALVSAVWPQSFGWVQQGQRPSVILGIIMLTMGCTLSTEDFKILLRRPWTSCWAQWHSSPSCPSWHSA